MAKTIRIGSRDSKLATWQAKEVQKQLAKHNISSEIIFIKSIGDLVQDKPLQSLGTVGVFTKALDDALLNHTIDIAVHSCKDLPSKMHPELRLCAYLEREDSSDVLVSNNPIDLLENKEFTGTIATGSVRRKAQLLAYLPKANVVGLRGNVPTRLNKLKENNWDGAVFALAGLKRLGIEPEHMTKLNFLVPAPAQGVVAIACRKEEENIVVACKKINHQQSQLTTEIERQFLHLMEGGCISPIGANAIIHNEKIKFTISVLSTDGSKKIEFTDQYQLNEKDTVAQKTFEKAKQFGAKELIEEIENNA